MKCDSEASQPGPGADHECRDRRVRQQAPQCSASPVQSRADLLTTSSTASPARVAPAVLRAPGGADRLRARETTPQRPQRFGRGTHAGRRRDWTKTVSGGQGQAACRFHRHAVREGIPSLSSTGQVHTPRPTISPFMCPAVSVRPATCRSGAWVRRTRLPRSRRFRASPRSASSGIETCVRVWAGNHSA